MPGNSFNRFRLFLSASVPKKERDRKYYEGSSAGADEKDLYYKIHNAQLYIEEAVISLARTVFANGGQLVFGGHPSISPLVATIAGEFLDHEPGAETGNRQMRASPYIREDTGNPPVVIYQSELFRNKLPLATQQMLARGDALIRWTPVINNEVYDFTAKGEEQCLESLAEMRRLMLTENQLNGMVCIGGMDGVMREFSAFKKYYPAGPVYVFETTGGASSLLALEKGRTGEHMHVIDEALATLNPARSLFATPHSVAYLSLASKIVDTMLVRVRE